MVCHELKKKLITNCFYKGTPKEKYNNSEKRWGNDGKGNMTQQCTGKRKKENQWERKTKLEGTQRHKETQ